MSPIPSHPLALAILVLAFGAFLAALRPARGVYSYLKYLGITVLGLCTLLLFGATIGKIIHDFLQDLNAGR